MAFLPKIQPYRIYEHGWSSDLPTDYEIDFGGMVNTFTIISGPYDLAMRLNSIENDLLEGAAGVDSVIINKILLTSATPDSSCKIYAAWEEQWV